MNDSLKSNLYIDTFKADYQQAFSDLNFAWIEANFDVEDEDLKVLGDPQAHIIDTGGEIFLAMVDDKVVGTAAMILSADRVFELSKMTVDSDYRRLGIARMLMNACIDFAKQREAKEIFLVTNDILKPALELYKASGFMLVETKDKRYARCNTEMRLLLEKG